MRYLIAALILVSGLYVIWNEANSDDKNQPASKTIKIASTTSAENTGLIYALTKPYEEMFEVKVEVISVGSGKALKLGEKGEVDLVLVHSPALENEFISEGYGVNRRDVMYNDFVIIGPKDDPANIKDQTPSDAFKNIADKKARFTSRGDNSGTHKKEEEIWTTAGTKPQGKWYAETGEGMARTLEAANENNAYCLTDRGTYLVNEGKLDLVIINEGDKSLMNPYSVIAINPALQPKANYIQAMTFIGWITSPDGQKIIEDFKKDGLALFNPVSTK